MPARKSRCFEKTQKSSESSISTPKQNVGFFVENWASKSIFQSRCLQYPNEPRGLYRSRVKVVAPPPLRGGVRIRIFWNPDLDLKTRGRPQEGCWAIHSIKYQNSQKSLFFQILQKYVENAIMRHTPSQIVGKMLPNRFGSDFRHIMTLFLNSSMFSEFWKIPLYCDHMAHPSPKCGENATKSVW